MGCGLGRLRSTHPAATQRIVVRGKEGNLRVGVVEKRDRVLLKLAHWVSGLAGPRSGQRLTSRTRTSMA